MKLFIPRLQQKITASIAILAVLLLFIAPVVSTSLMEHTAHSRENASMADMPGMNMAAMPDHEMQDHAEMGVVCGYCDLLIHVPLMLWAFVPLLWLVLCLARWLPPLLSKPLLAIHPGFEHRPRGPPKAVLIIAS